MPSPESAQPTPLYANVIVPRHIARVFTYLVPPALAGHVGIGQGVVVPFGRSLLQGAIVSLTQTLPSGIQRTALKPIDSLAPALQPGDDAQLLFTLSRHVAEEYLAPWGQCLRLLKPWQRATSGPTVRYVATPEGKAALKEGTCPEAWHPLLTRIARRSTGVLASTLLPTAKSALHHILQHLQERRWIDRRVEERPKRRTTATQPQQSEIGLDLAKPPMPVTDEVSRHKLAQHLWDKQPIKLLLHGPANFRLDLLISAIRDMATRGRSVLILTGEQAKAAWLAQQLRRSLDQPVHLAQEQNEPAPAMPSILVGTRSAIFAPMPALGMIWIEGEDDTALKEPQEPHYHAREVAWRRAQLQQIPLILTSAHPSLETQVAVDRSRWITPAAPPPAPFVSVAATPPGTLLSPQLSDALRTVITSGDRAIVLFNRKGFAGALVCRDCGWIPRCQVCQVALPYFREQGRLTCRYCGTRTPPPDICPTCGGARLTPVGEGTERLELELRRQFPDARMIRVDRDLLKGKSGHARWDEVQAGHWDLLIGTQVIFERTPLPPVSLVGILQADAGLHVPDFRAAERTHQLLTDAVGQARPASDGGHLIVQTALPHHPAIQAIASHDSDRFYRDELAARHVLGYPPAVHLILLIVSGKDLTYAEQVAQRWAAQIRAALPSSTLSPSPSPVGLLAHAAETTILGPVLATGRRTKEQSRWHMLVKGRDREKLRTLVRDSLAVLEQAGIPRTVKCSIDVDPVEMG